MERLTGQVRFLRLHTSDAPRPWADHTSVLAIPQSDSDPIPSVLSAVREFGLDVEPVAQDPSPEREAQDAVTAGEVLGSISEADRRTYVERKYPIEEAERFTGYFKTGWEAWLIVISIPFTYMLQSFMSEAGKEAYSLLKRLLKRLRGIDDSAWLVLRDSTRVRQFR